MDFVQVHNLKCNPQIRKVVQNLIFISAFLVPTLNPRISQKVRNKCEWERKAIVKKKKNHTLKSKINSFTSKKYKNVGGRKLEVAVLAKN